MRRQDKEITDPEIIDSVLREARVCRIALCDGGTPYIVPLSFGHDDGYIYLHCAPEGRKIDILKVNPRVCFELATDYEVLPAETACRFTMRYRSVIGYGVATFVEETQGKIRALHCIMRHYTGRDFTFTPKEVEGIAVIRIAIEEISGKQSGFVNANGRH